MKKTEQIIAYAKAYLDDFGFEAEMVKARQRMIVEILARERPQVVVEVGCGADMLHQRASAAGLGFRRWMIVEPAEHFYECARAYAESAENVVVIRGFFEDSVESIKAQITDPPDMILLSGNLHEVPDPRALLGSARELLSRTGLVHVNVPSALSFHRRLAVEMGLIPAVDTPSERQKALYQPMVHDPQSLRGMVTEAGFTVEESGGYLIKPFTHAQMEAIGDVLTDQVLDGLWRLGREFPELASEIYVNARSGG